MFSGFKTARKAAWLKLTQLECELNQSYKLDIIGDSINGYNNRIFKTFIPVDITSQYFVFQQVANHVTSKIEYTPTVNTPYVDGSSMDVLEEPSLSRTPYTPNTKDVSVQTSIPTYVK